MTPDLATLRASLEKAREATMRASAAASPNSVAKAAPAETAAWAAAWAELAKVGAEREKLIELLHWALTAADRLAEVTPAGLLRTGIRAKADEVRTALQGADQHD